MERSRKLVLTSWTQANNALNTRFEGNKSKLADHLKMSRTTVTNFFSGKPVRTGEFCKICKVLWLNWESVSSDETIAPAAPPNDRPSTQPESQDDRFQQVKERCRQNILTQHSRMRLLSGEVIEVDQLYVDVWLLNRSPRTFQVSPDKLLETFDLRNDRLGLGDRIKRNPGFEVAGDNPKLVILGKPGAGKTTFLKHLAVDWCKGQFQPDSIAILIELRQIQKRQWNLLDAISKIWDKGWKLLDEIGKELGLEDLRQVKELLQLGKLLVLIDGLDEVPTDELRRNVQAQLQQVAEDYPHNRFILTCRTQIIMSIPRGFTSVEVADFSEEQIQQFAQNWFKASGKSETEAAQQWKTVELAVGKNPALKELTVTPVLLSLICLVLQDEGEIPSRMDGLYERGIRLLLSKWNDEKEIQGWELGSKIYAELSIERREALLIEIAARKFENPENFVLFKQDEIAAQITDFLQLANRRDGVNILKAIEAQHGLLIERADALWSFSHLTFQEHFTIRWLTQLSAEQLAEKIANQQWQERVRELVKSQQPADRLARLIKRAIDQSIAQEPTLQNILVWTLEKSESVQAQYKPAAIRAFYIARDLDLARDLARDLALDLDLDRGLDRALLNLARALNLIRTLDLDLALAIALAHARDPESELANKLEQLRAKLPSSLDNAKLREWWQANGTQWVKQLRQVAIQHRNIGHDWQLTEPQQQQFQRYYDANRFLVELVKIEGAVSDSVRAEIEENLLLPWA